MYEQAAMQKGCFYDFDGFKVHQILFGEMTVANPLKALIL